MKIDISYAEMSFLRELVAKKDKELWGIWFSRCKTDDAIKKVQEMKDGRRNLIQQAGDYYVPISDEDCCTLLILKFEQAERECKIALGMIKESDSLV